ncbi:NAD(P)/FAD-dependent oxidoreductase [Leucobacter soli]|uniref:NAD(P)/FAD-dependent oxidoreductase n=1 Tax=Leucobacter soli TaxID=2812850 RepID=UPI00361CC416
MDRADVVIIGGGQAAAELVKSLRREAFAGSIHLIGDEDYLPYDRPPLSKGVMKTGVEMDRLAFLNAAGYEKHGVTVDLGVSATAIDPDARTVSTSDGRRIGYEVCVLATGARAVPAPWHGTSRVHSIRTYADAQELHAAIEAGAKRFLVVGGGYLGLETASSLAASGLDVSLVEATPQLLTGRASRFVSDWLKRQHEERGVEIFLGSMVAELEERDDTVHVRLANGTEVEADQVVFAVGALANLDLAKAVGAECGRGVLVDERCETTVAGVYAIGDVASYRTGSGGEARVESVFNATSQAKNLARVIAGKDLKASSVPTFWSDQVGVSIRLAGWVPPTVETNDVVTQEEDGWLVERYLGGRLVGVEAMNRLVDYMRILPEIADLRRKL